MKNKIYISVFSLAVTLLFAVATPVNGQKLQELSVAMYELSNEVEQFVTQHSAIYINSYQGVGSELNLPLADKIKSKLANELTQKYPDVKLYLDAPPSRFSKEPFLEITGEFCPVPGEENSSIFLYTRFADRQQGKILQRRKQQIEISRIAGGLQQKLEQSFSVVKQQPLYYKPSAEEASYIIKIIDADFQRSPYLLPRIAVKKNSFPLLIVDYKEQDSDFHLGIRLEDKGGKILLDGKITGLKADLFYIVHQVAEKAHQKITNKKLTGITPADFIEILAEDKDTLTAIHNSLNSGKPDHPLDLQLEPPPAKVMQKSFGDFNNTGFKAIVSAGRDLPVITLNLADKEAQNAFTKGDYLLAMELWQMELARQKENNGSTANILFSLGKCFSRMGDYSQAMAYFKEGLELVEGESTNDQSILSDLYTEKSILERLMGKYREALATVNKALAIDEELNNYKALGDDHNNLALIYFRLGKLEEAVAELSLAREKYRRASYERGQFIARNNLGLIYLAMGDSVAAEEVEKSLWREIRGSDDLELLANVPNNLGRIALEQGNADSALQYQLTALEYFEKFGDPFGLASSWLDIGKVRLALGEMESAIAAFQEATEISQNSHLAETGWRALMGVGEVYFKQKKYEEAGKTLLQAIEQVEMIRGGLARESFRTTYMNDKQRLYDLIITIRIKQDDTEGAWEFSERSRARSLLDALGGVALKSASQEHNELLAIERELLLDIDELQREQYWNSRSGDSTVVDATYEANLQSAQAKYKNHLDKMKSESPELASLVSVVPVTRTNVLQSLPENSALVEYHLMGPVSYAWIIKDSSMELIELPVSRKTVEGKVDLFRLVLLNMEEGAFADKQSQDLYNALWAPLLPYLKDATQVCIVPHGKLHYLPFSALRNKDGKYLVDDYVIWYVPSASAMAYFKPKVKKKEKDISLFALGNPALVDTDYPALPWAESEVEGIAEYFPDNYIYYEAMAMEQKVRVAAGDYDLLHFACHGELNLISPALSSLMLAPGAGYDGRLEVHEIFSLDLKAELVALSACETGLGGISGGDDLTSLARSFFYAGSPAVVASLWSVNDLATSMLMASFYEQLQSSEGYNSSAFKADALTQAQRGLKENELTSHPFFWAPFVFSGNPAGQ